MVDVTVCIFEDERGKSLWLRKRIQQEIKKNSPNVRVRFRLSYNGLEIIDVAADGVESPSKRINWDRDLNDSSCDILILDLSLSGESGDISTGMRVLKSLSTIDNPCRNICIDTGYLKTLRDNKWEEFEGLVSGNLFNKVAIWGKKNENELIEHIKSIVASRSRGIRHSAGEVSFYRAIAGDDEPVLVLGERGVGKEEFARAIHHNWSNSHPSRAVVKNNFVRVNCASFSAELIRAELFGYVRGSFTGAEKNQLGLVLRATGLVSGINPSKDGDTFYKGYFRTLSKVRDKIESASEKVKVGVAPTEQLSEALDDAIKELRSLVRYHIPELSKALNNAISSKLVSEGADSEAYLQWIMLGNPDRCIPGENPLELQIKLPNMRAAGTLFLDEIGDLSPGAQAILLRFLNSWEVQPVGYAGTILPDLASQKKRIPMVKVIAATNNSSWMQWADPEYETDLEQLENFRPDLFDRVSQWIVFVQPPTSSEVRPLIELTLRELRAKQVKWERPAIEQLESWVTNKQLKGNRRQLKTIIRRATTLAGSGSKGLALQQDNVVTKKLLLNAWRPFVFEGVPGDPITGDEQIELESPQSSVRDQFDSDKLEILWTAGDVDGLSQNIEEVLRKYIAIEDETSIEVWQKKLDTILTSESCDKALSDRETWRFAFFRTLIMLGDDLVSKIFEDAKGRDWHHRLIKGYVSPEADGQLQRYNNFVKKTQKRSLRVLDSAREYLALVADASATQMNEICREILASSETAPTSQSTDEEMKLAVELKSFAKQLFLKK